MDMSLSDELKKLSGMHYDLEKQLIEFNSIIPFDKQQDCTGIYSPRLVNLLLATCPQIETVCRLIDDWLKIASDKDSIPGIIKKLNKNNVLTKIKIYSKSETIHFFPFTNLDWWTRYNKIKHNFVKYQCTVEYADIISALAALAVLHHFAKSCPVEFKKNILNIESWQFNNRMLDYGGMHHIYRNYIRPSKPFRTSFFESPSTFMNND